MTPALARLVALLLLFAVAGCGQGHGASLTGPNTTMELEQMQAEAERQTAVTWRGARVVGHRAAEMPALLERAWPQVAARWPGWEPTGYTIESWEGRIPCAYAINGRPEGCRGTTTPSRKQIRISWVNGPADVVAVAAWESCNAARYDLTRELRDVGCGR